MGWFWFMCLLTRQSTEYCIMFQLHRIGFCHCDSVDLTLQFLSYWWLTLYWVWYKDVQPACLFWGSINFLSLTHTIYDYGMFQLLMHCVVWTFWPNNDHFTKIRKSTETLSGWVWSIGMRPPMTVVIDTEQITSDDNKIATLVYWYSWKQVAS